MVAKGFLQKSVFENQKIDIENLKNSLTDYGSLDHIKYYDNPLLELGDTFKTLTKLYYNKEIAIARFVLNDKSRKENHDYSIHPLVLHSAYLVIEPLFKQEKTQDAYLPFGVDEILYRHGSKLEQGWVVVKIVKNSGELITFDAGFLDDDYEIVAKCYGCSLKKIHLEKINPEIIKPAELEVKNMTINTTDLPGKIQKYLMDKIQNIILNPSKKINIEMNLMDTGLESSQLIAVTNELQTETGITLNPTLFFENPNIKGLTNFFVNEHSEVFKKMFGEKQIQTENQKRAVSKNNTKQLTLNQISFTASNKSKLIHKKTEGIDLKNTLKDDYAIIGMSGKFADSSNLDEFLD